MDRSAFIKTMIEVLKYDRKYRTIESRDQLLRLIGRARVNFVPQYEFDNLLNAESKGKYHAAHIKFSYRYKRQ